MMRGLFLHTNLQMVFQLHILRGSIFVISHLYLMFLVAVFQSLHLFDVQILPATSNLVLPDDPGA